MIAGLNFRSAVGVMALSKNRAVQFIQLKNPTSVNIDPRLEGDLSACKFLRNLLFRFQKKEAFCLLGLVCWPSSEKFFSLQRFIHFLPGVKKLRVE